MKNDAILNSAPPASKKAKDVQGLNSKKSQKALKADILSEKSKKKQQATIEKEKQLEKSKKMKTGGKLKKGSLKLDNEQTQIDDSKEDLKDDPTFKPDS